MSRIGKAPIQLPAKVEIEISKGNLVTVKGPKGILSQQVDPAITISVEEGVLNVLRHTEQKKHKSLHGLYRALINNMVTGVSDGYTHNLELVGVGYRVANTGNILEMTLGYSHPIYFEVPKEIAVETKTEKGINPMIFLRCNDKQLLGMVSAKIKTFRKSEPYKGKGIKFAGELVRRKAGKTAGK
jgi:large subunit ribosomal protein L6